MSEHLVQPRVVITDCDFGEGDIERSVLGPFFDLEVSNSHTEDDVIAAAQNADALLVQWAPITQRVLQELPRVRMVVRYGIGLDNVNTAAASSLGVEVRNVPDYCITEVAHHTLAMIVADSRRIVQLDRAVKQDGWAPPEVSPRHPEDNPVGVVGLGRIGRAVTALLSAAGFPVLAWDPLADRETSPDVSWHSCLGDLAEASEHLTLHIPLTPDTQGMIDSTLLRRLGPTGHLVNTSRGGIVNENDLLRALDRGDVRAASLDVLAQEPPSDTSHRVATHPRVVATPHVAYLSDTSLTRLRKHAAELVRDFLRPVTPEPAPGWKS